MDITSAVGKIPYRIALAGGWIDQPFVSSRNSDPIGSMVVVNLEPRQWFLERAGIATGTRNIALKLWPDGIPDGTPEKLVRDLYAAENQGKADPSGSQDMIGLIYPGVSRLDYDYCVEGGIFPAHIETNRDPEVCVWVERVVQMIPVNQRPDGYNPLGRQNLDPDWIAKLGRSGRDCFVGIVQRDVHMTGAAMNLCMDAWSMLLPDVLEHPTIRIDLRGILKYYQSRYPGAMYSGCGGGYIIAVSEEPIPEAFRIKVRC